MKPSLVWHSQTACEIDRVPSEETTGRDEARELREMRTVNKCRG